MESKWIAQDKNGKIFKWRNKPIPTDIEWFHGGHDFYQHGRENPNWQNSLINLETNDYKIEDGILMRVEKKEPKRIMGSELQRKNIYGEWIDCDAVTEYRLKPKTKTVRFRNFFIHGQQIPITTDIDCSNEPWFRAWCGDWKEVEVPNE